nr:hypothetical protein [Paraburkholderia sp. BL8N3]
MQMPVSYVVSQPFDQGALVFIERPLIDKAPVSFVQRERIPIAKDIVARTIPRDESELRIIADSYHLDTLDSMCLVKYAKKHALGPCTTSARVKTARIRNLARASKSVGRMRLARSGHCQARRTDGNSPSLKQSVE